MSEQTQQLRKLLDGPDLVVVPECYSALTALIAEDRGFQATYIGGHAMGGMHHGIPDHGLITTTEMVELAANITDCISIPLICDADQAGETSLNVRRAVKSFERAGVAAIHIEDTFNPKHLGAGDRLQPVGEMCARIKAAVDARTDPNFLIIARTDELFNKGTVDEVVRRGQAYAEAGADVYMVLMMQPGDIDRIANQVPIPLLDIMQPLSRVKGTKLKVDVWCGFAISSAAREFDRQMEELLANGEFLDMAARRFPQGALQRLTRDEEYTRVAADWIRR
jgi:2-methylisocitrate lyase-like PEP mutase family enzyme